jgi:hypothetical protein
VFRRPRRFWPLYIVWSLVCLVLFFALSGLEDPSRPTGRILPAEAGQRAASILREQDPARFGSYRVVHVARGRAGEGSPEDRWVVLLDKVPHTSLREAIVVEIRSDDGTLLRIRPPAPAARRPPSLIVS